MIRINLLPAERKKAKSAIGFEAGQKVMVLGSILLLLATLGIGWRYWTLEQHASQLARELTDAQQEELRLAEVLRQVQQFEARREQLQQRASLIDELRRGQSAPVHIIDQMSRALPEMTWLTQVRQQGFEVTIDGRCLSLTSLSDFIGNLEASRYFKRPVEILSSEVVAGDNGAPDTIRFSIRASFQMAGIEPVAVEAAAGGGRPSAAATGGPRD